MQTKSQRPLHPWRFPAIVDVMHGYAGSISLALCFAYLLLGLWPLHFQIPNKARFEGTGLHFEPMAIVLGKDISLKSEFSIEMDVSVETEAIGNIQSFFSIYDGAVPANICVGRWRDEFLIRFVLLDANGRRKVREIGVRNALSVGKRRFLAIVSGGNGTSFFIDGKLAKAYPRIVLPRPMLHGQLLLGDSPDKISAFTGKLFGFALFNRALSPSEIGRHKLLWEAGRAGDLAAKSELAGLYLFEGAQERRVKDLSRFSRTLVIPENYPIMHPRTLSWEGLTNPRDIVINILGFIPFGFFCCIWLWRKGECSVLPIAAAILASAIISVSIELSQVFLPTRSSSLRDLICNILGGAIGVVFAAKASKGMRPPAKN